MSNAPPSSSRSPKSGEHQLGRAARVLVIDDSVTILKVVGTILTLRGYDVAVARDGADALNTLTSQGPFDLVLLDFVMPRMNGYQFCRQLRADPQRKDLAVVLMSARTPVIGDRFVEQTGAVDALSKPFDARALIAVVENVLAKRAAESEPRSLPSIEMMAEDVELDWSEPADAPPPSRHFRSMGHIGQVVASAVAPAIRRMRAQDLSQQGALEDTIAEAIDEKVVLTMVAALDDLELKDSGEVLRGEINKMPLAELMQLLQLRRQTGLMRVRHGKMSMVLAIREGTLDFAQGVGTGPELRLGRYFVEAGFLSHEQLEELLPQQPEDRLLGEWLVEQGALSPEQLTHALANQSAELVYEVIRWPDGRFVLTEEPFPDVAEKARLGMGVSELVLEGFRRVDEWRYMADTINFESVLVVDQAVLGTIDDSKIDKRERSVLMSIDGTRSAREVMEASHVSSFDAIKAIYRLLQARIIREVKAPKRGGGLEDSQISKPMRPSQIPKAGKEAN
jgi:CheY-like chemotaxis protein